MLFLFPYASSLAELQSSSRGASTGRRVAEAARARDGADIGELGRAPESGSREGAGVEVAGRAAASGS